MQQIRSIIALPGHARVQVVTQAGAVQLSIRNASRIDDFCVALGRRLDIAAHVEEPAPGGEAPLPGRGVLLLVLPDVLYTLRELPADRLRWVVALDLDRTHVLVQAEQLGLAAAVEDRDYRAWLRGTSQPPAVFGRQRLAPALGAETARNPLQQGERYARMSRSHGDLPALLADYLQAYDAELGRPG